MKFKDGLDPNYANTNWSDVMIKTVVPQHRSNLSVSGSNEKLKYYLSIGELYQGGQYNYGTTEYKQYNFRSNIEVTVSKYLRLGLNLAGRYEKRHYPVRSKGDVAAHIYLYRPSWTLYWPGTDYLRPNRDNASLYNWVSDGSGTLDEKFKGLESTMNFELKVPGVEGLTVQGSANYDTGYSFNKSFRTPSYVYYYNSSTDDYVEGKSGDAPSMASLGETFAQSTTLTINGNVSYARTFGAHNLNLMVGYEQMEYDYDYLYAYRSDYPSTVIPQLFAGSSDKNKQSNDGNASKTSRENYFGRTTYDYAGKYLAQLIFRYDGSPNFASDKRWGFFPGVSMGWRVSEESFMSDVDFLDNLKIRGSYGEMGNDRVASFQYLTTYGYGSNYVIGSNDVIGVVQSGTPNSNITWEVAKTTNLGFEATLWKGLLSAEFDIFKTRRSNILTKRTAVIPEYTGLTLPDENVGIVENKGFELQLTHQNNLNEVKYSIGGDVSFARNKVIFADEQPAAEEYQKAEGRPIGSALYYHATGIFNTQQDIDSYPHMTGTRLGDVMYEDVNGDQVINSRDRIRIDETIIPELVYGIIASVQYKNFDMSILFQGQENAKVYFGGYFRAMSYSGGNFTQWRAENRWTPENTNATMPRASQELWNNNTQATTQWVLDNDFLRLKNLEIGYNLPQNLCKKVGMKKLRLYVSGNNLLILYDHMKDLGIDPESTTYWYYSQQRTFNAGINLTF